MAAGGCPCRTRRPRRWTRPGRGCRGRPRPPAERRPLPGRGARAGSCVRDRPREHFDEHAGHLHTDRPHDDSLDPLLGLQDRAGVDGGHLPEERMSSKTTEVPKGADAYNFLAMTRTLEETVRLVYGLGMRFGNSRP